jgi:hypothetical protein
MVPNHQSRNILASTAFAGLLTEPETAHRFSSSRKEHFAEKYQKKAEKIRSNADRSYAPRADEEKSY